MKRHNHLLTVLTAAILLGSALSFTTTATKPQTVEAVEDMSDSEDFSQIKGHDANHPIWPHSSLGVIVRTNDPTFLADVQEACDAWAPVFTLHDYGYVHLQPGQKINSEHGKLRFVYITDEDLSASRAAENNDVNGITSGVDPDDVNSKGYFEMPSVSIRIDSAYTVSAFSQYGDPHQEVVSVIEHELGHAIGLRHSTNHADVMYAHDLDNSLQPDELGAVRRMYENVTPVDFPDQLPIKEPQAQKTTSESSNSSSYSAPTNRFYMTRKNADKLTDAIDDNLYVINSSRYAQRYRNHFRYSVTKGSRNYTRRHWMPNGTYRVHYFNIRFVNLKPRAHWQHDRFILAQSDADVGDYVPYSQQLAYCHSFYVRPYSKKSTHRISFTMYVRVHGRHFSIVR